MPDRTPSLSGTHDPRLGIIASRFCWSMFFSENRSPLLGSCPQRVTTVGAIALDLPTGIAPGGEPAFIRSLFHSPSTLTCACAPSSAASIRLWLT